jgi:CheY-like chemotaxis protein
MAKKILMVDDNAQARAIGRSKLVESGFEVMEATDGVDCLKIIEGFTPDLILLDLMMPVMDGFKVLQVLKTNPRTKEIPVIVLSGRGQAEEISKGLKLGAADFLVKMRTTPKILLEKVTDALAGHTAPLPGADPGAAPAASRVIHYHLAIKEQGFDAERLATDFKLPRDYRCGKCGNPLLFELVPDFSHSEPWFSGHFVCPNCR